MTRRTIEPLITLARAILVAPLIVDAQPPAKVPRIGFLGPSISGDDPRAENFRHFQEGLREFGNVEGQNRIVEWRLAEHYERYPSVAAELVRLNVDVSVVTNTPGTLAAKHATTTIPIVMVTVGDPVGTGLVASLARPGGNITGITVIHPELSGKRLELLKEVAPGVSRVAVLLNPDNPIHGNLWTLAASCPMVRAAITNSGAPPRMSTRSSKAPSPPTCPWSNHQIWGLTRMA
jgi:putative tryptophan/tyrosine transport system substrate-binding protein